jgi:hypothetical protein
MRWTSLFLAVLLGSGCTHNFLKNNTLRSSSTLSTLQTQQVLDNLAMLSCNEAANPCHLNLSGGLIQATDQGTASLAASVFSSGSSSNNNLAPSLSAQRGLVQQWSVSPVTDGEQLETMRVAYRKALDPADPNIDDAIMDQIVELCVRFSLLPKEATLRRILKKKQPRAEAWRVCEALRIELGKLDRKIFLLQSIAEKWEKNKDYVDHQRQVMYLEEKKELREQQRALLLDLAQLRDVFAPRGDDTGPVAASATLVGLTVSPWGQAPFLALSAISLGTAPKTRTLRRSAFTSRGTQRQTESADASDTTQLILTALQAKSPAGYLPPTDIMWESARNPALVDQAEDQIGRLEELLDDSTEGRFRAPWIYKGCKKDIPRDACYVGHFKGCKQECYIWVMPEQYAVLRQFTQIILTLAATVPQDIPPFSPAFSPSLR